MAEPLRNYQTRAVPGALLRGPRGIADDRKRPRGIATLEVLRIAHADDLVPLADKPRGEVFELSREILVYEQQAQLRHALAPHLHARCQSAPHISTISIGLRRSAPTTMLKKSASPVRR